jgi:hypothetical protein
MDRGALYLYEDRVYVDTRGRLMRGFGDAHENRLPPGEVNLAPGLSVKTVYQDDELVLRPLSYDEDEEETAPVKAEAPLSSRTKRAIVVGVGVALAGAVLTGGFMAWRKMRANRRTSIQ